MDLRHWDALSVGAAIADGDVSPREVTQAALDNAHAVSPTVGAFTYIADDYAMQQAARAEATLHQHRRNGTVGDLSMLFGVPCPIKDLNPVAGLPWEAGSRTLAGNVASIDDGVVTRLHNAGTITVGKTSTPEFGFPCYTEPDTGPAARTVWDLSRSAGGSSGGAAAAVSAGIVPIAHGSDGGGSIRIPAAACGLVGLKPSRGLISPGPSRVDGPGLTTDGVLTRSVRDTAAALDIMAGPMPGDYFWVPPSRRSFLATCDHHPMGLRVGVLTTPVISPDAPIHPAALRGVDALVTLLSDVGCIVDEAPVPFDASRWNAFDAIWTVGAASLPLSPDAAEDLVPLTQWLRSRGQKVTGVQYAAALTELQRLTRDVADVWKQFDVILTPTLAQPPALIGSIRNDDDPEADFAAQMRFTPWTSIANLTGRPSISLPTHTEVVDGVELPFATMLTGVHGGDATLLALASTIEAATLWQAPWRRLNS